MRLFVALDIDSGIRQRITQFRDEMRRIAPTIRWAAPEGFHITLQFLGETKKLDKIKTALHHAKGVPIGLIFRGAGFFPSPKAPRVFWIGTESDGRLQELVGAVADVLKPLGFEREAGPYKPHLTLARSGSGRRCPVGGEEAPGLHHVRVTLERQPQPEFGTMTAREFYLYESKLSPGGSHYTKLERYPLG